MWAGRAPGIVTSDGARPAIPSGTSAGDVTAGRATVWTCDLGHEYVRLNAEYTT